MDDQRRHPPRCTDPAQGRALESYLERTLDPGQEEAFEEHFFSCPACREELRLDQALPAALRGVGSAPQGSRTWLAVVGLAAAAMLAFTSYLGFVELPRVRERLGLLGREMSTMTASLDQLKLGQQGGQWSGPVSLVVLTGPARTDRDGTRTLEVRPDQPFVPLAVVPSIPPAARPLDRLLFQIREGSGRTVWEAGLTASEVDRVLAAERVVTFLIPAGALPQGDYTFVVVASEGAADRPIWQDSFYVTRAE